MSPNELNELRPIAETLNQESNEINKIITSLNAEIARLNLGIEVWLDGSETDPDYRIGFGRVEDEWKPLQNDKGTWQLATSRTMKASGSSDLQPLLKASRNLRIEGLQRVPTIIAMLKREAEDKIAAIQNARKLVAELAASPSPTEDSSSFSLNTRDPRSVEKGIERLMKVSGGRMEPIPVRVQKE